MPRQHVENTKEFWSENEAKRANKHAKKRIIYWPPFWNKMYCLSSTNNFENHIHLFKSSVQIHVLHLLTCMEKGFNSIDRNQAFESHNNPHVFNETRENLSLTKDSVSRYFLPWIMFYLPFEKNRISRCELLGIDPIHKWRLFYFCSIIVQISLPSLNLEQEFFSI